VERARAAKTKSGNRKVENRGTEITSPRAISRDARGRRG
jgi:hypothetical protein